MAYPRAKRSGGCTPILNHLLNHIESLLNLSCALNVIIGPAAKALDDDNSVLSSALRAIDHAILDSIDELRRDAINMRDSAEFNRGSVPAEPEGGAA